MEVSLKYAVGPFGRYTIVMASVRNVELFRAL